MKPTPSSGPNRRNAIAAITGLAVGTNASAQAYPAKPIKLLIGVPPPGTQDVLARAIANQVKDSLGTIIQRQHCHGNRQGG
jgi:tripartite-type tricarboxylate transporter receptor subunit TctC